MPPAAPPGAPSPAPSPGSAAVWAVAGACVAVEAMVWLLGAGTPGAGGWVRARLVDNAGFWPGLLRDWGPNWPGQGLAMFWTYAFVHAGPGHLLGNMGALAWLGPGVARRLGTGGFVLAWTACAAGGGLAFAALSRGPVPMVGASGALFGLLGVEAALRHRLDRAAGAAGWPRLAGVLALFVALNGASYALEGGRLAWQAHLGGFLAGLALGAAAPMRPIPTTRTTRATRP